MCIACSALNPAARVLISNSRSPQNVPFRQYSVKPRLPTTRKVTSSHRTRTFPSFPRPRRSVETTHRGFYWVSPRKALPALATPKSSTAPVVQSDFDRYLQPLYRHGWQMKVNPPNPGEKARGSLRRILKFPKFKNLIEFIVHRRNARAGSISVFPNLGRSLIAEVWLHSPDGVTPSLVRNAVKTERRYRKLNGGDRFAALKIRKYEIMTPRWLRDLEVRETERARRLPPPSPRAHIFPVPLPPSPPIPPFPSPALTDADLETYLAPLITNGWVVRALNGRHINDVLKRHLCLTRAYHFANYGRARRFLQTVVEMASSRPRSPVGGLHFPSLRSRTTVQDRVGVRMDSATSPMRVTVWLISKLGPDAPKKYGPSLANVHFAIELENEIYANWAGRVDTSAVSPRFVPKTAEELWSLAYVLDQRYLT
ncbi:hypothetical protein DFH07DRAFT_191748 [Mycena maculata]|uniref:Uncharacterized protein n=1 Tax=Mycena maculata TaxID=230809 RepID=A0AAD7P0N2_9AGAR|nr:hypothetical protein DFH07DRAFT_191748 [Mycena maculata]